MPSKQQEQQQQRQRQRGNKRRSKSLYKWLLCMVVLVAILDVYSFVSHRHQWTNNGTHPSLLLQSERPSKNERNTADAITAEQSQQQLTKGPNLRLVGQLSQITKTDGTTTTATTSNNQTSDLLYELDTYDGPTEEADTVDEGKDRIKEILERAGETITPELYEILPTWSDIVRLYGSKPIIYGLDTCSTFRSTASPADAYIGPAGMFNTGTNLLAEMLHRNCYMPDRRNDATHNYESHGGMRWQVPWGKHTPAQMRLQHIAPGDDGVNKTNVLPVVTIKDPYTWMGSMCRHSYAANWRHHPEHCPNLIANDVDVGHVGIIPVNVRYRPTNITRHESLLGLWNDWYGAYHHTDYPRLVVRFEDLLFHPEYVMTQICHCGGGRLKKEEENGEIRLVSQSAKGNGGPHSGSSGLLSAILRYGNANKRIEGMTMDDLEYARNAVDSDLMTDFNYMDPDDTVERMMR